MMRITTLVFTTALLALASVGCGSECGDLQDACDNCDGANAEACQAIIDGDDDAECSDVLATYEELCAPAEDKLSLIHI